MQAEAVELTIVANTITAMPADSISKAAESKQHTDYKLPQPEQTDRDPLERIVKIERKMSRAQKKYKYAQENYGPKLLNLIVAKDHF